MKILIRVKKLDKILGYCILNKEWIVKNKVVKFIYYVFINLEYLIRYNN